MFGISWNEYLIIAVVALIVIGPKELPRVLRTIGQWTTKVRRMATEFQGQFQEALREAEMADLKNEVDNLSAQARSAVNFEESARWDPETMIPGRNKTDSGKTDSSSADSGNADPGASDGQSGDAATSGDRPSGDEPAPVARSPESSPAPAAAPPAEPAAAEGVVSAAVVAGDAGPAGDIRPAAAVGNGTKAEEGVRS